jgi:hypothetical protein
MKVGTINKHGLFEQFIKISALIPGKYFSPNIFLLSKKSFLKRQPVNNYISLLISCMIVRDRLFHLIINLTC